MSAEKNIVLDVIQHKDGSFKAILPEAKIRNMEPVKKLTKAPLPEQQTQGMDWAPWGKNDRLPTEIRCKLEKVPMAGTAISKLIAMMYGNGLAYYRNSELQDGKTKVKRAHIPAIESFLQKNKIKTKWLIPQFADYRYYINTFSEMVLNRNRDQIVNLYHKPAEFCRLGAMNERTLNIDKLYFSPDFAEGMQPAQDRRKELPLYVWHEDEQFHKRLKRGKFAYHSRFETPGITYYARPFWIGLFRENGWIDVSANVPEIVNSMMRNQVILKYQILIPESYFQVRYHEWDQYSDDERNDIMDKLIDSINENLSGTQNAYKSITTLFKEDEFGNKSGKIEILAIDDKMKKDNWVPSSEISDAQIVQGLGLHPSQVGLAPQGGKMGAGSGSDQRESFNTGISLNTIDQEIVLEPLNYVAEFNARINPDWDVTFFIDHTHHTTTNNKEDGMQPSDNTIQVD